MQKLVYPIKSSQTIWKWMWTFTSSFYWRLLLF